jgi:hypothetical protein
MEFFNELVSEIENQYSQRTSNAGWRFLYCSEKNINQNNGIYFVTLNPGGSEERQDQGKASCEEGNAIITEMWRTMPPGSSPLQKQIQEVFKVIGNKLELKYPEVLENALSGYFIPFRSKDYNSLESKKGAYDFGISLWTKILLNRKPSVIITIDRLAFKGMKDIAKDALGCSDPIEEEYPTGWGNVRVYIARYDKDGLIIVRFPHLSRFTIFTSQKSETNSKEILIKALGKF